MNDRAEEQRRLILDQFTKQAVPFAEMPAHSNEESLKLLIDMAKIGPEDDVLDVACGPAWSPACWPKSPATLPASTSHRP